MAGQAAVVELERLDLLKCYILGFRYGKVYFKKRIINKLINFLFAIVDIARQRGVFFSRQNYGEELQGRAEKR